jgi:hypothetical protein
LTAIFSYTTNGGIEKTNGTISFLAHNTFKNVSTQNPTDFIAHAWGSDSSDKKQDNLKKKRIKGIEKTVFFVSNQYSFRETFCQCTHNLFSQQSYMFDLFSSNGKRGPPSV